MKYPCIVFSQRPDDPEAPKFCVFEAPVGEVLEWADIPRLTPDDDAGIQRAKNDYKVKSINKFLTRDKRNTIPTAIVISLSANSYKLTPLGGQNAKLAEIELDAANKKGAFVVDGQHRLYGLSLFSQKASTPIVAILDASDEEKAFQFIVINNKVTKVATDHIRNLAINLTDAAKDTDLEARLHGASLSLSVNVGYVGLADESEDSPFKGLIAMPKAEGDRFIAPAAIESSIAYIQSKRFRQLVEDDATYEFFINMWAIIRANWKQAFAKESKLLSKVGLVTMTRYLTDAIDFLASFNDQGVNLANAEDVSNIVTKILALQSEQFWVAEWTMAISDTKAVRDEIESALKSIQQNVRDKLPWSTEVGLVKKA
jgi:DGQHR domain-containing protein